MNSRTLYYIFAALVVFFALSLLYLIEPLGTTNKEIEFMNWLIEQNEIILKKNDNSGSEGYTRVPQGDIPPEKFGFFINKLNDKKLIMYTRATDGDDNDILRLESSYRGLVRKIDYSNFIWSPKTSVEEGTTILNEDEIPPVSSVNLMLLFLLKVLILICILVMLKVQKQTENI
tara:strand:- start:2517 stop:3038 length:522 start_codon:yes stop_codon:yes gene_type:complete